MRRAVILLAALGAFTAACAATPDEILERYAVQARSDDPGFTGFSAAHGEAFYREPHVVKGAGSWSCASCHLRDPRYSVRSHRTEIPCRACHVINDWEHPDPKHAKKRNIEAFAPSANAKRLTDSERVEAYLKVNCLLLLKRECTAREKGDVIAWLLSIEGSAQGDEISYRGTPHRRGADW
ncbi:MAG: DUF1924 domain-containing protein [Betaproteobacteria bacterium]